MSVYATLTTLLAATGWQRTSDAKPIFMREFDPFRVTLYYRPDRSTRTLRLVAQFSVLGSSDVRWFWPAPHEIAVLPSDSAGPALARPVLVDLPAALDEIAAVYRRGRSVHEAMDSLRIRRCDRTIKKLYPTYTFSRTVPPDYDPERQRFTLTLTRITGGYRCRWTLVRWATLYGGEKFSFEEEMADEDEPATYLPARLTNLVAQFDQSGSWGPLLYTT